MVNQVVKEMLKGGKATYSNSIVIASFDDEPNKYSDQSFIDYYTGVISYGYKTLNFGFAEGLYRTINGLVAARIDYESTFKVLDLGCGSGRILYQLADRFRRSMFVGMDTSLSMLSYAEQLLINGDLVKIDLEKFGLGTVELPGKKLENVSLVKGDATQNPFKPETFDCVINNFLIDRVSDPESVIRQSIEILKPGGLYVLANPLNFQHGMNWEKINGPKVVINMLEKYDIEIEEWFDGLVFRELLDVRGNYADCKTLCIVGRKKV